MAMDIIPLKAIRIDLGLRDQIAKLASRHSSKKTPGQAVQITRYLCQLFGTVSGCSTNTVYAQSTSVGSVLSVRDPHASVSSRFSSGKRARALRALRATQREGTWPSHTSVALSRPSRCGQFGVHRTHVQSPCALNSYYTTWQVSTLEMEGTESGVRRHEEFPWGSFSKSYCNGTKERCRLSRARAGPVALSESLGC
jgi:hypothetical protein